MWLRFPILAFLVDASEGWKDLVMYFYSSIVSTLNWNDILGFLTICRAQDEICGFGLFFFTPDVQLGFDEEWGGIRGFSSFGRLKTSHSLQRDISLAFVVIINCLLVSRMCLMHSGLKQLCYRTQRGFLPPLYHQGLLICWFVVFCLLYCGPLPRNMWSFLLQKCHHFS